MQSLTFGHRVGLAVLASALVLLGALVLGSFSAAVIGPLLSAGAVALGAQRSFRQVLVHAIAWAACGALIYWALGAVLGGAYPVCAEVRTGPGFSVVLSLLAAGVVFLDGQRGRAGSA